MPTRSLARLPSLVTASLSHPALPAALLYILTRGPPGARSRLLALVPWLRDPARTALVVQALKWVLALRVVGGANRALNALALNNWRVWAQTGRWQWEREVAVVTGGCSGIGALIVKKLVGKGVRVVVFDVAAGLPGDMSGVFMVMVSFVFFCLVACLGSALQKGLGHKLTTHMHTQTRASPSTAATSRIRRPCLQPQSRLSSSLAPRAS